MIKQGLKILHWAAFTLFITINCTSLFAQDPGGVPNPTTTNPAVTTKILEAIQNDQTPNNENQTPKTDQDKTTPTEENKSNVVDADEEDNILEKYDNTKLVFEESEEDFLNARKKGDFLSFKSSSLPIFGTYIFRNPKSTFAPNNNRPTPLNYTLGPGDAITVRVSGLSEAEWNLGVSPEGYIILPAMGKIYVSGKTIENATLGIESRLRANNFAIGRGTNLDVILTSIRSMNITIMGEIMNPAQYSVSSLTTVFNALHLSGGVTRNGTIRAIEIYRDNRLLAVVDAYDYLLRGDLSSNFTLKDGDIIKVPEYRVRVSITGQIKRNAYYEVLPGETLSDIIMFAGGYTDIAFREYIKAIQLTDKEQKMVDIKNPDVENYIPLKGDRYFVPSILSRFENRLYVSGSVYRPGAFALEPGMKIKDLIEKASGLKEDAYMERGYIARQGENLAAIIIPFNLKNVMEDGDQNIELKREDVVTISSIFDFTDAYGVQIHGAVRNGGSFGYFEGMTVEDLILSAGGFSEGAEMKSIQISRRVKDSDRRAKDAKLADIFTIEIDPELKLANSKFQLQPHDIVSVFTMPGYVKPQIVKIEGEVMRPGYYALRTKADKISDLVDMAGGFTDFAYLKGSTFKRHEYVGSNTEVELFQEKTEKISGIQEGETENKRKININSTRNRSSFVALDLQRVMKNPGKVNTGDLVLMDGDVLNIPRELQTVRVSGAIQAPSTMVFEKGKSLKEYVMESGGYAEDAKKGSSYVLYANANAKGTKSFIGFRDYPNIEPGAEIFIPYKKPKERTQISPQFWLAASTTIASLGSLIFGIIVLSQK